MKNLNKQFFFTIIFSKILCVSIFCQDGGWSDFKKTVESFQSLHKSEKKAKSSSGLYLNQFNPQPCKGVSIYECHRRIEFPEDYETKSVPPPPPVYQRKKEKESLSSSDDSVEERKENPNGPSTERESDNKSKFKRPEGSWNSVDEFREFMDGFTTYWNKFNSASNCYEKCKMIQEKEKNNSNFQDPNYITQCQRAYYAQCQCEILTSVSAIQIAETNKIRRKNCEIPYQYQRISFVESIHPELKTEVKKILSYRDEFQNQLNDQNYNKWIQFDLTYAVIDEFTKGVLNAKELSINEKKAVLNKLIISSETLKKLFTLSTDIATSSLPLVGDVRDLYELATGKDLLSGEEIGALGRISALAGLIAGNGAAYRKIFKSIPDEKLRKIGKKANGIPKLTFKKEVGWTSEAGIIYEVKKIDKAETNRLRHVFNHSAIRAKKAKSLKMKKGQPIDNLTFFNKEIPIRELPAVFDAVYKRRSSANTIIIDQGRNVKYRINVKDLTVGSKNVPVGDNGEEWVDMVFKKNTSKIITTFPKAL